MKLKKISKSKKPIFKSNGSLSVGDSVMTPLGDKKIISIQTQKNSKVYRISLSDGRTFRTNLEHLNTVSFRKFKGESVWENVTTNWLKDNITKYIFKFPQREDVFEFSDESRKRVSSDVGDPTNINYLDTHREKGDCYISSVEKVDNEDTRCITLDYDLGLYYTGDYIITHNSVTSTLHSLFVTTRLWQMRNPKKFFALSQNSSIVQALISFTMEKASQLLLQPFMQILLSSPKFHRVKQEEHLNRHQFENPDKICWTTAGRIGALQFYNDLHYIIASQPSQLLGLNMIMSILSEISFFVDKGFSTEYIWRIYQDSKGRVRSRFEDKFFAGTVLDSSPNDIELSPIDKYIFQGRAYNDPSNYVVTGSQWEYLPHKFKEWQRTGETFPVFKGSQGKPAKILLPEEVNYYKKEEIYDVPIDVKNMFEENVIKSVKDYCGWPSGSQGALIRDDDILERMFDNSLKNIYTHIYAPESKDSRHLIWNEIHKDFFVRFDKGYEFYRHPLEKRYIHVDQAETGDMASISMVHPETDAKTGDIIYVTDFTLAISPEKGRINLDAIRYFIQDLKEVGNLHIGKVTFDQYQSSATIQYLKDKGFDCGRLSVDSDVKPYYAYISHMASGKVKCGKNIFLKNNLMSLQEISTNSGRKKVDHTKGKIIYQDGAVWDSSEMGKFAKDVSDSHCGAIWNAIHEFVGVPRYTWEDKTEKSPNRKETIKKKLYSDLEERYGFATGTI